MWCTAIQEAKNIALDRSEQQGLSKQAQSSPVQSHMIIYAVFQIYTTDINFYWFSVLHLLGSFELENKKLSIFYCSPKDR